MKWEHLQTFYVLINNGSIAKAAKQLNIHPTTVSRHASDLEKQVGARILKKQDGIYVTTTDGEKIYKKAEYMAKQAWQIQKLGENLSGEIAGTVRITSLESLVSNCLITHMPRLRKQYPKLTLEFLCSDDNLSFNNRETDLAIRIKKPNVINIVTRKLGNVGFALYCSVNNKRTRPKALSEIKEWVTYDENYLSLPEAKWLGDKMKHSDPVIKSSNAAVLKAAIRSGLGVGILPCYRGDTDKSLIRLSGAMPVISREAWLLIHSDYRSNPKTCCVIDWISDVFERDKKLISGQF